MARKTLSLITLSLLSIFIGCGGSTPQLTPATHQTITAAQVFSSSMVGQTWTFTNSYGDTTTIEIFADYWHFTKNSCRAYWNPGDCTAELFFGMKQQPDGSFASPSYHYTLFGSAYSTVIHTVPGQPTPYTIVPASGTEGIVSGQQTSYVADVSGPTDYTYSTSWLTDSTVENGQLVSEQFEGCVHEKWYFAPGRGLVKIIPIVGLDANGNCIAVDPGLTLVRL